MTPNEIYATLCEYLTRNGWQREEPGSGWWIPVQPHIFESTIGDAVDEQLLLDGIDTGEEPTVLNGGKP